MIRLILASKEHAEIHLRNVRAKTIYRNRYIRDDSLLKLQFQVPQFINVEDKIFGPFTFKQFIYLAGGAGFSFVLYKILPIYISIFLILPVITLSLMLTFYCVNDRPFILTLENAFKHLFKSKMYLWKKEFRPAEKKVEEAPKEEKYEPKLSGSRLKELSWSLDVLDMKK